MNVLSSWWNLHSHVSPEQYRHRCACLTFTVMDYDWLSTNDFAGEAVAPLSDFCWPGRPNATAAGKTLQPFILHLSRQKPSGMLAFHSLYVHDTKKATTQLFNYFKFYMGFWGHSLFYRFSSVLLFALDWPCWYFFLQLFFCGNILAWFICFHQNLCLYNIWTLSGCADVHHFPSMLHWEIRYVTCCHI